MWSKWANQNYPYWVRGFEVICRYSYERGRKRKIKKNQKKAEESKI